MMNTLPAMKVPYCLELFLNSRLRTGSVSKAIPMVLSSFYLGNVLLYVQILYILQPFLRCGDCMIDYYMGEKSTQFKKNYQPPIKKVKKLMQT
jgi:hypothetical protein